MIDVSIVIVTYNSGRFMPSCLGALPDAASALCYEVIVVDNASDDDSLAHVAKLVPSATVVANDDNTGFAAASNQGIREARGRYVLLLNPDAVAGPGSIAALVHYADGHPGAGVAGPRLLNADRSLQLSVRNFPTASNQWFEALLLHRVLPRLTTRFGEVVADPAVYEASGAVGWVSGAAMLLRPAALEEVGLLDESFFMYSEEKDLCFRMRSAGWSVDFVPDASVVHGHDGYESPEAFALQLASRLKYFRKHLGTFDRLACTAAIYTGFLVRVLAGSIAALMRSERRHHLLLPLRGVPLYFGQLRSGPREGVAS